MGLDLLQAISDMLSDWSMAVSNGVQRLTSSTRQPAASEDAAAELHGTSTWLLLAAGSLLQCMWSKLLYSKVPERQLLDTLGQLVQRVLPLLCICSSATVRMLHILWLLKASCALRLSSRSTQPHLCWHGIRPALSNSQESLPQAHSQTNCLLPPQVVACEETAQRATVARLWPSESALPAAVCVKHLTDVVTEMLFGRGGLFCLDATNVWVGVTGRNVCCSH